MNVSLKTTREYIVCMATLEKAVLQKAYCTKHNPKFFKVETYFSITLTKSFEILRVNISS